MNKINIKEDNQLGFLQQPKPIQNQINYLLKRYGNNDTLTNYDKTTIGMLCWCSTEISKFKNPVGVTLILSDIKEQGEFKKLKSNVTYTDELVSQYTERFKSLMGRGLYKKSYDRHKKRIKEFSFNEGTKDGLVRKHIHLTFDGENYTTTELRDLINRCWLTKKNKHSGTPHIYFETDMNLKFEDGISGWINYCLKYRTKNEIPVESLSI